MKNILIILLTAWSGVALAQTNISGLISSNTTWTSGGTYIITGNTVVNTGIQLTIEPGVLVKFDANKSLLINGTMQAVGTALDTVVFTSNQPNPQSGDWRQIAFSDLSMDYDSLTGTGNLMRYCKIEYGGGGGAEAQLLIEKISIEVTNSKLMKSQTNSIKVVSDGEYNVVRIRSCVLSENAFSGVYLENSSNCNVSNTEVHVLDCVVASNDDSGLRSDDDCPWLCYFKNNLIMDNNEFGIWCNSNQVSNFSFNYVKNNNIGIVAGSGLIDRNIIEGNNSGILSQFNRVTRNLIFSNQLACRMGVFDTITNNIFFNNTQLISESPLSSVFSKNHIVDNQCEKHLLNLLYGSSLGVSFAITHNTMVRNRFTGIDSVSSIYFNPINSSQNPVFSGNNIYGNTNVNGDDIEISCNNQLNINTQNCYWGTTDEQVIQDVIYDFLDDPSLAFINYAPYLNTPDTIAPVTPPMNVQKTDLGNGQIQLCWSSNLEEDLSGYRVYYGNPTGYSFSNSVDVGNVNMYALSSVSLSDTIAITAYDISADGFEDQFDGHESWFTVAENAAGDCGVVGIETTDNNSIIKVYPNPTSGAFMLETGTTENYEVEVFNALGQSVFTQKYTSRDVASIELSSAGIYHLRVFIVDAVYVLKVVKE